MKTIAERVGVSKTTVHRALTNSGRISEDTREKILKIARELDYRPNNFARGLRSQKSAIIGAIATGITNSFYATILEGIQAVASDSGYSILLACSDGKPSRELMHFNVFKEMRVDGIIVAPAHPKANMNCYQKLLQSGTPFAFIDRYISEIDTDYVTTDNFVGGYIAGKHLISLGRKRIGFGCTMHDEMPSSSVKDRLNGLKAAIQETEGVEFAGMVGLGLCNVRPLEKFASTAIKSFIRCGNKIDGILATNDNTAIGIMAGLEELKMRAGEEVAVVGFDDLDIAQYLRPALTTVRQPMRKIGEEAMRVLLDRMSGTFEDIPPKHFLLKPELIIRESCGSGKRA